MLGFSSLVPAFSDEFPPTGFTGWCLYLPGEMLELTISQLSPFIPIPYLISPSLFLFAHTFQNL
jgi:hypothetical protein